MEAGLLLGSFIASTSPFMPLLATINTDTIQSQNLVMPLYVFTFNCSRNFTLFSHFSSRTPSTHCNPSTHSTNSTRSMTLVESGAEETKVEHHMAYNVHPFELEEGTPEVLKAKGQPRKHNRKFAFCAVFVSSVLILGILAAIFYPRTPHVSLYSSSLLDIDGFTGKRAGDVRDVALDLELDHLSTSSFSGAPSLSPILE